MSFRREAVQGGLGLLLANAVDVVLAGEGDDRLPGVAALLQLVIDGLPIVDRRRMPWVATMARAWPLILPVWPLK